MEERREGSKEMAKRVEEYFFTENAMHCIFKNEEGASLCQRNVLSKMQVAWNSWQHS